LAETAASFNPIGPGRVAVITPYLHESEAMLLECHRSVIEQGVGADHFLIADGHPRAAVDGWEARHVILPRSHADDGSTPRGLGGLLARREGYDFVAYLDADNWYHPGHLRSLLDLHAQSGSPVCASLRTFHDLAGAPLPVREEDEDALRHIDTSCLLLARPAFACLGVWLDLPEMVTRICDRVFVAGLRHAGLAIRSSGQRSVAYRSRYEVHYEAAGVAVPASAKAPRDLEPVRAYLLSGQGVTECVEALGFWPPSYAEIL
jgi:hypothetical protein